ncbi:MAG: alpha/beta fold hydrolase [Ilumatobacter sp.]|nr:alpha/beta fold hydrolase [Ilumatobacter sp.]
MRSTARRRSVLIAAATLVVAACSGSDTPASSDGGSVGGGEPPATTVTPTTDPPVTEPPPPPPTEPAPTEPPTTPDTVPATTPPVTEPASDDIVLDDAYGPYEVGVATLTIADASGGDRNLTVDVWFPLADGLDTELPPQQYTLLPGTYYESPYAVAATPDALSPDGPFPLVVYSHGSGGLRYIHSNYTEAIASNGYLVVAPDHIGNTAVERLAGTEGDGAANALNRPRDVTAVIDAFLNPESQETVGFVGSIDPGRIAVTGHSFGGFTAYAMAAGFDNELGEFVADERVGAIITLAPAAGESLLTDERLASIDIPALVMVGTDDTSTPIEPNVTRPWELTASSPSYRVDLVAAEHQTFTDVCAYQDFMPTLSDVPDIVTDTINDFAVEGCSADDMPIERAQAITNSFAVAFLDSIFKDGTPIDPLTVDEQPDLIYQST